MSNNVPVDEATRRMAKKFEEAMLKHPVEEQIAVGVISKNVLNGCSWEFVRPNPEIRRNLDAFAKNPNCSVQKVTYNHEKKIYGYLIYMKMPYLCSLLSPGNNGPLNDTDIAIAQKHREEAKTSLMKKLKSKYKGKIGIFCTNDSQNITISGKTYSAYAVTLKELCVICKNMGYGIVVAKKVRNPDEVLAREDGVIERSTIAPSSNALLIEVAPM